MKKSNAIEVKNLIKTYGDVYALNDVDLNISDGEYFVLLGPSGGGKTTLLRSIGGFIRPDSGSVEIKGKNVNNLPPDKRPTSMVFQGFALFPHMDVVQNIGYGLKLQSIEKNIIDEKVNKMMDLVGLTGLHNRKPHELSGGQQQRVQLARALILENDVLLLDEPLSALDAQLRKDMCIELKRLQKTVGISFVHVTHNQEEAMSVADRIAIISISRSLYTSSIGISSLSAAAIAFAIKSSSLISGIVMFSKSMPHPSSPLTHAATFLPLITITVACAAVIPGNTAITVPATLDRKQGTMRGPGGGNSQSSFCGGNSCVVEYMSIKFAIPKRPAI